MNFPNLNTDSFYKFLTILGLVIVVFSSKIIADRFVADRNNDLKYYSDSITLTKEINDLLLDKKLLLINDSLLIHNNLEITKETYAVIEHRTSIEKFNNSITLKKGLIAKYRAEKEDSKYYLNFIFRLFTIIWILGFMVLFLGFIFWYNRQQKIKDKELLRDYINLGRISMICESCGKGLTKDSIRPKEKDGGCNFLYCCDCYKDGEFTEPIITLSELKKKIGSKYKSKKVLWFRLLWIEKRQRWR